MPFDAKAYEQQVLKPLRRTLPNLPDDLLSRYAIDLSMDDGALRERVQKVLLLWNKHAMRSTGVGLVAQQLRREHERMVSEGQDPSSAAFWRGWEKRRAKRLGPVIEEVARRLATNYGELGVITPGQLRVAAAAHGELAEPDIEQVARQAGLQVIEPIELPSPEMLRGRLGILHQTLLAAGVSSVAQLLFPELTSFRLLDGLIVTPTPHDRSALDAQALEQRAVQLQQLPDSSEVRAAKEAVGILASEATTGGDLRGIALCQLLVTPRAHRAEGADALGVFKLLARAGLERDEAGLLAVSVVAEPVAAASRETVDELLAGGRLMAARQAATVLGGSEGDEAREAVQRQQRRVEELRDLAARDLSAGREERARSRLTEAVRLAGDLDELHAELAAVPATRVLEVTASSHAAGARVAWRAAPDHGPDTTYRVVRGHGRDPVDLSDGTDIPTESGDAAIDQTPPVGSAVHYAVFARTAGQWSRPRCASVVVVPPVREVRIEGGAGEITGHWKTHPDAIAVEVWRTAEPGHRPEPIAVEGRRSFRDTAVGDGVEYSYRIIARYPPSGDLPGPRSEAIIQRATTRVAATPVTKLTATAPADGRGLVRFSWQHRAGAEVVVRHATRPCPWPYGARVTAAELSTWGNELRGQLRPVGRSMTLTVALPPGLSYCVPFTMEPGIGVRGQDTLVELLDPVRSLRAQRLGDDVSVSWVWPEAASIAELRWDRGHRRVTRQEFREQGGCTLTAVPDLRQVLVTAVMIAETGEERFSSVVSVSVPARPPQLTYQLAKRGSRLLGGVKCTVTLSGAEPVSEVTVVLAGSPGKVMPLSPDGCLELLRACVAVRPGEPQELPEVTVPPALRKPYWLRCFLLPPTDAVLNDPPVSQLKVM